MNIAVPVRQVPDTGRPLKISETKLSVDESRIKWILSPYDEFALEEALKLRPLLGGKVFVLSAGPARVKEALMSALALGADEALHIETEKEWRDPLLLAQTLSKHLKSLPEISLTLCGKLATDINDFAVPQMLAQFLNIPFVTNINALKFENGVFQLTREGGGGVEEILSAPAPLVLSADKGLNQPRYPSLPGIMKARKKPFKTLTESLPEEGIPRFLSLSPPGEKPPPVMIDGSPQEQVKKLFSILREKEKLL